MLGGGTGDGFIRFTYRAGGSYSTDASRGNVAVHRDVRHGPEGGPETVVPVLTFMPPRGSSTFLDDVAVTITVPYATPWDVSKVLNVEANAAGITGDPGDATVNFLSTIQVIDVEIPPGATLSAASGTDYFALPEPRTALPLGVVLALRGLRRSGRNHDVGRTKG